MNRIGITCDDTNHVRTLHEMKLYRGPVGEQDCIHGMVQGAGRTEDTPNNIEVLLSRR